MRLSKLTEFRRLVYTPESAPTVATLRKRIDAGVIPGGRKDFDGHYYVDLDEFDRATNLRAGITASLNELARSPLLEGLI